MWKMWRPRTRLPAVLLLLGPALAQQQPAGTSGDSTTPDSVTGASTQGTAQRRQSTGYSRDPRPVYLYGRVMADGGAPPGESAAIESACDGTTRIEGYTDSKGRFSFGLGDRNSAVTQDASVGPGSGIARGSASGSSAGNANPGGRRLDGCELRASLPGYESETITLAGRLPEQSDVGVIFLHRLGPSEGVTVSMTSLAAPKDAQRAFRKGREALAKGKPEDARKSIEKATSIYPRYATAWFELGRLQLAQHETPAARASFEAAIRAESTFLAPYVALATLQVAAHEWPLLEETTARAIAIDPYRSPQMYFYNAVAKYFQQDLDGAEKSVREAERLDRERDIVRAWELLGSILAARRDFAGAAEQFRTYLALVPHAADATEIRARLGRLDRLSARVSAQTPTR
jgi:tetratricopeptide (TPR) repeat protein